MTFELLKVCRQANPTWIELQVMYSSRTLPATQFKPGLLADKCHIFICVCVCVSIYEL